MSHLANSRDGLFVFDEERGHLVKIADGSYFGMARLNHKVFVFGFEGAHRTDRTNKGAVWSFYYKKGKVFNLQCEFTGLDNGCHQMVIFENHLYIPETYLQRLVKIRIDADDDLEPDTVEYLNLWPEALNVHYGDSSTDYLHVNAVTVQDDRFFFMCPYLGRKKLDRTSKIQVWDPRTWTLLDEYELDRWYCHDLVVIGHEVYFCDALNSICKLNLVTREVHDIYKQSGTVLKTRNICRALSINSKLEFLASTTVPDGPAVIFTKDKIFEVNFGNSFTCMTRLDGLDFNDPCSPLRKSQVMSYPARSLNFFSKMVDPVDKLFEKVRASDFSAAPEATVERPCPSSMEEFLNPSFDAFIDLESYIDGKEKVVLSGLVDMEEFKGSVMYPMSGTFYYYAKGHGMGWHTNQSQLEKLPHTNYRCYLVKTTGRTFFFYRHPVSAKIHAVHDVDASVNIFRLCPGPDFFWHAIGAVSGNRLSIGYRTNIEGVKNLSKVISDVVYDQ